MCTCASSKPIGWMGTTSMKHEMSSFVDIGMKGFNKGVGFTMRVYFLRI
jgi:hypothetical protein